jgi:hypothetical protein
VGLLISVAAGSLAPALELQRHAEAPVQEQH